MIDDKKFHVVPGINKIQFLLSQKMTKATLVKDTKKGEKTLIETIGPFAIPIAIFVIAVGAFLALLIDTILIKLGKPNLATSISSIFHNDKKTSSEQK